MAKGKSTAKYIHPAGISNNTSVTSTYNGGTLIYNGSSIGWTILKSKYIILNKEIEVEGDKDFNVAVCVSLINTLGIEYYIELKKQEVNLPKEIDDFLEKEIVSYYRNKTIDEIMK